MIRVKIYHNINRDIFAVDLYNHGDSIVCAGVSALAINTVNSLEELTEAKFTCEYEEEGGLMKIRLPEAEEGKHDRDAALLMNSLALGLRNIAEGYREKLKVEDIWRKE